MGAYGTIILVKRGEVYECIKGAIDFVPVFGRDYCEPGDLVWTVRRLNALGYTVEVRES